MLTYDKDTKEIGRDGKSIGKFDEATGWVNTMENLPPVLKGQVRKMLEAEGCIAKGFKALEDTQAEGNEHDKLQTKTRKMTGELNDGGRGEGEANSKSQSTNHKMSADTDLERGGAGAADQGLAVVPACPPSDPRYGDKTPAVVEWFRDHEPAEFARRYGRRKTHLSSIIRGS